MRLDQCFQLISKDVRASRLGPDRKLEALVVFDRLTRESLTDYDRRVPMWERKEMWMLGQQVLKGSGIIKRRMNDSAFRKMVVAFVGSSGAAASLDY